MDDPQDTKHGKALAGIPIEELRQLMQSYLADPDKYLEGRGRPLRFLDSGRIGKYRQGKGRVIGRASSADEHAANAANENFDDLLDGQDPDGAGVPA